MALPLEASARRVPLKVAIPIVALCAGLGVMLGRVYPLEYFAQDDGAPSSIATAPYVNPSPSASSHLSLKERTHALKTKVPDPRVSDLAETSTGTIDSPVPVSEARPPASTEENPIGKATYPAESLNIKKIERAQKKAKRKRDDAPNRVEPAHRRQSQPASIPRPKSDRDKAREEEPKKGSILSQLPIVGPVIELVAP